MDFNHLNSSDNKFNDMIKLDNAVSREEIPFDVEISDIKHKKKLKIKNNIIFVSNRFKWSYNSDIDDVYNIIKKFVIELLQFIFIAILLNIQHTFLKMLYEDINIIIISIASGVNYKICKNDES